MFNLTESVVFLTAIEHMAPATNDFERRKSVTTFLAKMTFFWGCYRYTVTSQKSYPGSIYAVSMGSNQRLTT